jgi:hypothetical protein
MKQITGAGVLTALLMVSSPSLAMAADAGVIILRAGSGAPR